MYIVTAISYIYVDANIDVTSTLVPWRHMIAGNPMKKKRCLYPYAPIITSADEGDDIFCDILGK